jgi:Telomeric repeat-binding factor 2.
MLRTVHTAAVLLSASLIAMGVSACGPDTASVSTSAKADSASSGSNGSGNSKAAPSKKKAAAKVGDTISLKGMDHSSSADVTVVKVVTKAQGADEFSEPESGKRFVAVQFKIKNTGSKAYSDSPFNSAKVVDTEGQGFDPSLSESNAGPAFPGDVNIAKGGTAKGFITFEVPKKAKIDKVQFTLDSGFADQTGQWNVR